MIILPQLHCHQHHVVQVVLTTPLSLFQQKRLQWSQPFCFDHVTYDDFRGFLTYFQDRVMTLFYLNAGVSTCFSVEPCDWLKVVSRGLMTYDSRLLTRSAYGCYVLTGD